MEIQKIGPAFELIDSTYLQPKPSPFPNGAFLKLPGLSPIKSLPNLHKTKKYASRPRILEHQSLLPREKKKVSLASASQLSKKKLLEAEVLVEDVQNPNLLHSLAKAFKKLDSAKKITLKLTSYGDLYLPAVRWLVWSLSRIKSLTSLTLYLPYHPNYKTNEYLQLLKPFTRNQHLQSFNLVIPIRYGIKSAVIHKVHDVLGRIKALKNVSVDLILSEYVYRVKPSILQRGLIPKLGSFDKEKQAFSVDVPYFVDRKEVVNLLSHVSLFNNLHCLKLNFSSFIHRIDGRIDDEVVNNIIPVLRNHKELVHLDLSFEMSWYLEENHIISLMKAISELSNLVCLKLNFSSCYGVTDQALKEISKALYRLPNLELVSLNVSSCYQLTDSGVQFLIGGLARNKAIKRFELLIASCYKLTAKGIESLLLFENLKALSLNLENCGKMDEAATLCLSKVLTRLNCLETVNLNLSYLMKMTNYEFCALGKAISGLSELKYLSLEIGGYKTITEPAFINFFRNLGVLKKLSGMVLNLRYNNQMTDRALSTLSIITSGFKELKELKIDLVGADMLTEKCYPKLVKVFAMFENSKNVEIFI